MNLVNIYRVLAVLGIGSMMLLILFFVVAKIKVKTFEIRIFVILSILYFIFSIVSVFLIFSNNSYQDTYYLFFQIIEAIVLVVLFVTIGNLKLSRLFIFLSFITMIYVILDFVFLNNYFSFNELTTMFLKLVVVLIAINFLKENYLIEQKKFITNRYFLMFISALIINFSLTFFISCFESIIRATEDEIFLGIWIVYQLTGIGYYSIISLNIWSLKK
jgi:hypothetical protein